MIRSNRVQMTPSVWMRLTGAAATCLVLASVALTPVGSVAQSMNDQDTPPDPTIDCELVDCDTICDDIDLVTISLAEATVELETAEMVLAEARVNQASAQQVFDDAKWIFERCTGNCTEERRALAQASSDLDEAEIAVLDAESDVLAKQNRVQELEQELDRRHREKDTCCPDADC